MSNGPIFWYSVIIEGPRCPSFHHILDNDKNYTSLHAGGAKGVQGGILRSSERPYVTLRLEIHMRRGTMSDDLVQGY